MKDIQNNIGIFFFNVQIGSIGVRLYTCYMIKNIYRSLGYYESYRREKEHAEFLEKLGNKIDEDKNKEGDNKDGNNNDGICEIKFDEDEENPEEYNENQIYCYLNIKLIIQLFKI